MSPTYLEYLGPVHAELKLLHDPGDHADRHRDQEELRPEPRHPQVDLVAGAVVQRLAQRHPSRKPDRHRHEDEMEQGRDAELRSRPVEGIHAPEATFAVGPQASGGYPRTRSENYAPPTSAPTTTGLGRNHVGETERTSAARRRRASTRTESSGTSERFPASGPLDRHRQHPAGLEDPALFAPATVRASSGARTPRDPPGKSQESPPGFPATRSHVASMAGIWGTYSGDTHILASS